jgi:hypothetical protein
VLKSKSFSGLTVTIVPNILHEPYAVIEYSEKHNSFATMVNFYPKWPDIDPDLVVHKSEVIFVVDRFKVGFVISL